MGRTDTETGYYVDRSLDGQNNWLLINTLNANVTGMADTGVLCGTQYFYRIQAYNMVGGSAFSNVLNISTLACPPTGPQLKAPGDGYVAIGKVSLIWTALKNAPQYEVQVDDNRDFSSVVVDAFVPKKATYTLSLQNFGIYYWRVRTQQPNGTWTDWSAIRSLTFTALKSPKNGSIVTSFLPKFGWMANKLATGGYQINVFSVPDGGSAGLLFTHRTTKPAYAAVIGDGFTYGHYQWNIQEDLGSGFGPNTPSFDLYITNMIKPANHSSTLDTTPSFSWKAIKGETSYTLEISTDAAFSTLVRIYAGLTKTNFTVPDGNALGQGQYYWRVVTTGPGSYTMPGWSFIIGP